MFQVMQPQKPWFWSLFIAASFAMVGGALFFQYVHDDLPCELCVYVRAWLLSIGALALLGLLIRQWRWPALLVIVLMLWLTLGLAKDTWILLSIDQGWPTSGACSFVAYFPEWMPLDKWWPAMFEVQNLCQPTPVVLLGISMAHALSAASVVYGLVLIVGAVQIVLPTLFKSAQ
ncbi:MAG: disulfide bond formation protein B [Pseudomonadota bacterium]